MKLITPTETLMINIQKWLLTLAIGITASQAQAEDFPWSPAHQSQPVLSQEEVILDKNATIGGENVYALPISTKEKDRKGDARKLGYKSDEANEAKDFTTELDLTNQESVHLAVLADDIASIDISQSGGAKLHSFSVHGGALWNPASFKEDSYLLEAGKKYTLVLHYKNNVHWTDDAAGQVDVDGVSIYKIKGSLKITASLDWKKIYRSRAAYGIINGGVFIATGPQDVSPGFINSIKMTYSGEVIESADGVKSFRVINGVPFPSGEKGGKVTVGGVVIQQFWIKPNETIGDVLKAGLDDSRNVSGNGRTVMVLGSVIPFYEEDINIIEVLPFTFSGPSLSLGGISVSSSGLGIGAGVKMGPFGVKAGGITFPWPYTTTDPQAPVPIWGQNLTTKNLMTGLFIAADGQTYKFANGNYKRKLVATKHNPKFGLGPPEPDERVAFPLILVSDESVVEVNGSGYISPLFDYNEKEYFWSE